MVGIEAAVVTMLGRYPKNQAEDQDRKEKKNLCP